ncbi:hypothetical protein PoB_006316500 [Plakobranchus ocellatus]|uniref:Uncharacterized protein n=1 Tax=Plakobranchus ocellatus TaxID=259542 RepID=A0AAV4CXY8_9GAST|nr:hypothetical protein PoB_006316500 [Plakobranchus ocellatus]
MQTNEQRHVYIIDKNSEAHKDDNNQMNNKTVMVGVFSRQPTIVNSEWMRVRAIPSRRAAVFTEDISVDISMDSPWIVCRFSEISIRWSWLVTVKGADTTRLDPNQAHFSSLFDQTSF